MGLHYMRATFVAAVSGQQWGACQASRCWPDSHTSEPAIIRGHCGFCPGFTWAEAFAECVHYSNLPHLCWAEFLPGWNPKCAEPGTANDFHALLNLTHVCLQHPEWFPVPVMVHKWSHRSTASLTSNNSQMALIVNKQTLREAILVHVDYSITSFTLLDCRFSSNYHVKPTIFHLSFSIFRSN